MSSLSSVTQSSNGWANAMPPKPAGGGKATERLFSEFDTDSSGSVDSTELQSLLSDVSQKTGLSISSSTAADLLSASDSNGDGSLSPNELQSLLDQMASDQGNTSSALSASEVISQLDSNGDGGLSASEFDAARPQGQDGPSQGGMPPPPPLTDSSLNSSSLVTGASSTDSTSSAGTSEDPLQALYNTIDSDQSGDISNSEAQTFLTRLASQLDSTTGTTGATGTSSSSSGDASSTDSNSSDSSAPSQDLVQLVQAARREYQAHMHGWNEIGGQLSASA